MTDDNKTIKKQSKSDGHLTVSIGQFYEKIKQIWQQNDNCFIWQVNLKLSMLLSGSPSDDYKTNSFMTKGKDIL